MCSLGKSCGDVIIRLAMDGRGALSNRSTSYRREAFDDRTLVIAGSTFLVAGEHSPHGPRGHSRPVPQYLGWRSFFRAPRFGPLFARELRRQTSRGRAIAGILTRWWCASPASACICWRAVDDEGEVLDLLVQRRRDTRQRGETDAQAAQEEGVRPEVLVTDKLRSYASASRELGLSAPHEQGSTRTIGPRIRISRCDAASASCSVSSRLAQPSAS